MAYSIASFWLSLFMLLTVAVTCTSAWQQQQSIISSNSRGVGGWRNPQQHQHALRLSSKSKSTTKLAFFNKMFEEEGILGKGITVGKVQVALNSPDRSKNSIFGMLEKEADDDKSLSELTNAVCLALLRKSDDWIGACGTSEWFGQDDGGKAESKFNEFANKEAAKFEKVRNKQQSTITTSINNNNDDDEYTNTNNASISNEEIKCYFVKEYIPKGDSEEKGGGATIVVVSIVLEIEGDSTK